MKILIDNGHGIETPAKQSPGGEFKEYKWNREVAGMLCEILKDEGLDAQLIVPEINDVSLKERMSRVNAICDQVGKDNVILISIHSNKSADAGWMQGKGWCCYTSTGSTRADVIAEYMYDAFAREFPDRKMRKDMTDGDRDYEANFYVLVHSKCPAVLLENFFYDNLEECQWLLLDVTKSRIAKAACEGLKSYLTNEIG